MSNDPKYKIRSQLKNLGYENNIFLITLDSVGLLLQLYILMVLIHCVLSLLRPKEGRLAKVKKYLEKVLYFDLILSILLESNLELMIVGFLNL
jgi:hypothetical protein